MSDPKRATLITVGVPKSAKNNVNKTVRLVINLDESNESKYPELNYKELVITEEKKKKVVNGKTAGLDPFSDNDDDVERVARKFEQKYGGKSTYGRKGRSKQDDFADIGAGYDENDSFIDNTHGYDEMIPPECDTLYGGFYINSGSLEFKTVPQDQSANNDEPSRRNKRRLSSSSSEEESSDSSSESESHDEKDKPTANGDIDSHHTEHRKKKNKKNDKKKAKKIRRTDSSAATSGKQTSDDNVCGVAESGSGDSRTSDSLASKPAPSSDNPATSDSSRDTDGKAESKLPPAVVKALEALETSVAKHSIENPTVSPKQLIAANEQLLLRLEQSVVSSGCSTRACGRICARAAAALGVRPEQLTLSTVTGNTNNTGSTTGNNGNTAQQTQSSTSQGTRVSNNKRTHEDKEDVNAQLSSDKEAEIAQLLNKLQALIDERKAGLIANYNAECQRVQEERKKLQICGGVCERRLPKRRFPWCGRARALLAGVVRAAGGGARAAALLQRRVLPLFPAGFVRMPTLLKQAELNKEIKATDIKRQRLKSASQGPSAAPPPAPQPAPPALPTPPPPPPTNAFTEQITFPSSLTVTTTLNKTSPDKTEPEDKFKTNSMFGTIMNSFNLSKELIVEKDKKEPKKEDPYVPPNNIGSITITPVPSQQKEKKTDKQQAFIRVKSPAALNEMVKKDNKPKKEKLNNKEKRVQSPLHVDTNFQASKKDPSPKTKEDKQIESLRNSESNIPRPGLVPVHHSPTFAKPDKRPPEKKKKEIVILSDVDPLSDAQEPLAVDDSSSDVEVIESDSVKCEVPCSDKTKCVPKESREEESGNEDIDKLMRHIREMEYSQETKYNNSNSHGGVITNAKHESSTAASVDRNHSIFGSTRADKFVERTSSSKTDGCNNSITG